MKTLIALSLLLSTSAFAAGQNCGVVNADDHPGAYRISIAGETMNGANDFYPDLTSAAQEFKGLVDGGICTVNAVTCAVVNAPDHAGDYRLADWVLDMSKGGNVEVTLNGANDFFPDLNSAAAALGDLHAAGLCN